jgi:hypothetical protein
LNDDPTVVFTDASGKEMHRSVGFQKSPQFLDQCVKGFDKLKIKLLPELEALVEKKDLAADEGRHVLAEGGTRGR